MIRRYLSSIGWALAFIGVTTAALFLGAGYAVRCPWRFARKAAKRAGPRKPPESRKAFDSAGIPIADWDRFCGEISAIQRDMVRAAARWGQP